MARVHDALGRRGDLPTFFSGHEPDGGSARSGHHRHLAFAWDPARRHLLIVAPHLLEHRRPTPEERRYLAVLGRAVDDLGELRAGAAGRLTLARLAGSGEAALFTRSCAWETLTPYRVTRHAKLGDPAAALAADLVAECLRCGLPRPAVEVIEIFARPGQGLSGRARLHFQNTVAGPILLGRDRHFGGGLFAASA
jgi:CRISPR-associated protein Csb2